MIGNETQRKISTTGPRTGHKEPLLEPDDVACTLQNRYLIVLGLYIRIKRSNKGGTHRNVSQHIYFSSHAAKIVNSSTANKLFLHFLYSA